jgi:hypothetical protein
VAALAQEVAVQWPTPASVEHLEGDAVSVPIGKHQGFVGAEICLQVNALTNSSNDQDADLGLVASRRSGIGSEFRDTSEHQREHRGRAGDRTQASNASNARLIRSIEIQILASPYENQFQVSIARGIGLFPLVNSPLKLSAYTLAN